MFLLFCFGQLMVNWWFGLVVWIPDISLLKGIVTQGYPESQTTNSPLVHQSKSPIQFTNLASQEAKELLKPQNMDI